MWSDFSKVNFVDRIFQLIIWSISLSIKETKYSHCLQHQSESFLGSSHMKSLATRVIPPSMQLHENSKDEVNTFSVSQIFLRYACIINTRWEN